MSEEVKNYTNNQKMVLVAKTMLANDFICVQDTLFECKGGIWKKYEPGQDYSIISSKWLTQFNQYTTKQQQKEAMHALSLETWMKYPEQIMKLGEPTEWINLQSYQYNVLTKEKREYKKENFCFFSLPFDLPKAGMIQTPEVFLKFCTEIFWQKAEEDEDQHEKDEDSKKTLKLILEWMGYMLLPGNPFQICLLLLGNGQNGKGKLMEVMEGIMGTKNCAHLDIKDINDGSALWTLQNKLVNFCGDVESSEQLDSSIMKRIIEGATMMAERKYRDQIELKATSKLVMAANDVPFSKNPGFAVERRFIMLPMTRSFSVHERDPDLGTKMIPEYSAILQLAINHLPELLARRRFELPVCAQNFYTTYRTMNDSVSMWIEDAAIRTEDKDAWCSRENARKAYSAYCKECNLKQIGPRKFYARMNELGFFYGKNGVGTRGFKGMKDTLVINT